MGATGSYLERPEPSGLADVIEVVLDRGLVVDAYVRVSLLGIELLTIDARIVVASVDTYLRFAEATNRLELEAHGGRDLTETLDAVGGAAVEKVAGKVAESKVGDVVETVTDTVQAGVDKVSDAVDSVLPGPDEGVRG
jgi:hypothetical protein